MKRIIGGAVFAAVLLLSNFTSMAAKPAVPPVVPPAKPAVPPAVPPAKPAVPPAKPAVPPVVPPAKPAVPPAVPPAKPAVPPAKPAVPPVVPPAKPAVPPVIPPAKPAVPAIKITNPLPGLDRLGYGYNVLETEDYAPNGADLHDLTEKGEYDSYQLRDITYQKPISVQVMEIGKTEAKWSEHSSVVDTQNAFSASMGIKGTYGFYSGSLEASFSKAVQMASETKIAMVNNTISGYEASLQNFRLKDEFQRDLQGGMAPQQIFQKYGTHMIQGVLLGGKIIGIYSSEQNETKTLQHISVLAKAQYKAITASASVSGSVDLTKEQKDLLQNVKGSVIIFGGSEESRAKLAGGSREEGAFAEWSKSVGERPIYACTTRTLPLWEMPLIKGTDRGKALERAFQELAARKAINALKLFKNSSNNFRNATLTVPKGYKILSGGAKTNWKDTGVLLTASYPSSNRMWTAMAVDHIVEDSGSIEIYVLALYDPFDLFDVKIVKGIQRSDFRRDDGIGVEPGYRLTGGGAKIDWNGGDVLLTYSGLTDKKECYDNVFTGADAHECERWFSVGTDQIVPGNGTMLGYAISIKPNFALSLATKFFSDSGNTGNRPTATRGVDGGYTLVGGGGRVTCVGNVGMLMTASYPEDTEHWYVAGKDHRLPDNGQATAYTIGLKVENTAGRFKKYGNNGTVSCNTYCGAAGADGKPVWGDKIGYCVEATYESTGKRISCDENVPGTLKGLICSCAPEVKVKHGDNGDVSCKTYCAQSESYSYRTCVSAWNNLTGWFATCDDRPTLGVLKGAELTCTCR